MTHSQMQRTDLRSASVGLARSAGCSAERAKLTIPSTQNTVSEIAFPRPGPPEKRRISIYP
jgi:hypothetical protein